MRLLIDYHRVKASHHNLYQPLLNGETGKVKHKEHRLTWWCFTNPLCPLTDLCCMGWSFWRQTSRPFFASTVTMSSVLFAQNNYTYYKREYNEYIIDYDCLTWCALPHIKQMQCVLCWELCNTMICHTLWICQLLESSKSFSKTFSTYLVLGDFLFCFLTFDLIQCSGWPQLSSVRPAGAFTEHRVHMKGVEDSWKCRVSKLPIANKSQSSRHSAFEYILYICLHQRLNPHHPQIPQVLVYTRHFKVLVCLISLVAIYKLKCS